jgi:hypothetical protein
MESGKAKRGPSSKRKKTNLKTKSKRKSPVASLIEKFARQLEGDDVKLSVSDYIRLLQFEREFTDSDSPKEVKVTWIDSQTDRPATEK